MARAEGARRHTREDVARAALRLLDEDGLQELSMRRLAAALDVQASALYWHFPNKQTLLADVADRIVGQSAVASGGSDASALGAEASALREALLAHRDGAEVVLSTLALGLGAATAQERLAAAAVADGYDPEVAERAAVAMLHFVIGHVSFEQQRQQYDRFGLVARGERAADDPAADFAFGVELLLAGLKSRGSV